MKPGTCEVGFAASIEGWQIMLEASMQAGENFRALAMMGKLLQA